MPFLLPRILALPKRNVVYLPGNKDVEVSLTHIDNLCGAVSWLLKKPPTGATVFNISDKKTYALRAILKELIEGSYAGNMTWCNLPMPLVSVLAHGFEALGIRSNLTRQSLEYFTKSAILNTDKIERETGFRATTDFDKEKPALLEWVKRVGLQRIVEQPGDLPWWSCKPVK